MRTKSADLSETEMPFFYGYWLGDLLPTGFSTLPITTVVNAQGGMTLSGGGCKVPIHGLYHIGVMARSDCVATPTANYVHLRILVNGAAMIWAIENNGSTGGVYYPYSYHQLWMPMPLNAGDVVTVDEFSNVNTNWFGGVTDGALPWEGAGLRVIYDSPWTEEP